MTATIASGVGAEEHVEEEFGEMFERLYPAVRRATGRLLADECAAEDAAMEAFGRALVHWSEIATASYRDAWVVRVAINVAKSVLRRRRLPAVEAGEASFEDGSATRIVMVEALRSLSDRQREVLVLRHLGGFSELEIAAALDVAPGTVKTHLKRGLEALRVSLSDRGSAA
ncbi:MAG: sigma-70 family RNA polymerase sigma factor [Acidimicrobiales bacterium]